MSKNLLYPKYSFSLDVGNMSICRPFGCFFIGEDSMADRCIKILLESGYHLLGVCSPTEAVKKFVTQKDIPYTDSVQVFGEWMRSSSCDFLFSVSNTKILSKELIELPRIFSINYHNAPLPKYAGVHATSWAILNGEKNHGATWHLIEEGVDTGDVLKQVVVDINNNDTNFTLDIKCMEKSVIAFRELLEELKKGTHTRLKQDMTRRTYYTLYQKPKNFGIISGDLSAHDVCRLHQSTNFSEHINRFCLPKFIFKDVIFFARKIDVLEKKGNFPAGMIVEISKDYIRVATTTDDVALSRLRGVDNLEHGVEEFAEMHHLHEGESLSFFDSEFLESLEKHAEQLARHESFWVRTLEGASRLNFWRALSSRKFFIDKLVVFPEDLGKKALAACQLHTDVRLAITTLLLVYMYRLNNCDNYSVGYRVNYPGIDNISMFFDDVVPMNVDFLSEMNFQQALEVVSSLLRKTESHCTFSRDVALRYSQLADHMAHLHIVVGTAQPVGDRFCRDDVDLYFEIKDDSIVLHVFSLLDEVGKQIVENISGHLRTLMEGVLANPEMQIKQMPLLTKDEGKLLLEAYNDTATDYPKDSTIAQIFENTVEQYPHSIAIKHGEDSLTYRELNQKANQLASYLLDLGVGRDSLVATFFRNGINSILSILAATKIGAAYTPIDPMYPQSHVKHVLQDTGALIILTQERDKYKLEECLPSGKFIIICVDSPSTQSRVFNESNKENHVITPPLCGSDVAYVMFTSGSSGIPKGVMIPHQGIIRLVKNTNYINVTPDDLVSQVASISFDASTFEIWTALLNGATLVCVDNDVVTDVELFSRFLEKEKITILTMVSALFDQYATADPSMFKHVKYLHMGGDVLNVDTVHKVINYEFGAPKFILNGYGPTENTTCTTVYSVPKSFDKSRPIPIGKPVSNTVVYVLDKYLNPMPAGIPGELCIGGDGLFLGYLNNDSLTAEKLISFGDQKIYKSGDLVRWLPDGNIDYICRLDSQAKVRGFRIELEAIELCLMNCHVVSQCAVVVKQDKNMKKVLVAYVVLKDQQEDAVAVMRDFLKKHLPHYMIPNLFISMDYLPQTPNGKINKKELLQKFQEQSHKSVDCVLPRNKLENDLANIWKELLGLSSVSINDNFFDLGGYSLLITEMTVRIKKQLDITFPLHIFLETPTLANLARVIESSKSNEVDMFRNIEDMFYRDTFLDPQISRLPDSHFPVEQKVVFITGATG
ncbi:MAG: amino acid adenylation domain-containing protein, partial [Holosporaceae bacterium]|nr:amino acid adenylation domain-containing protein [Holosporaceae bacterium]